MSKPVVFVIGASGSIGSATIRSLSSKYAHSFDIRAGVRDPDKADKLTALPGVSVVKAAMGDQGLASTFKGVEALFIVCPGILDRDVITIATAKAAKAAGVKHVLVVSGPGADRLDTVFGPTFYKIEIATRALGIPFTFLRLPLFVDNYCAAAGSIKSESTFYFPFGSNKDFTAMVVEDAGKAAAAILTNPAKHAGKTYTMISNRHNLATLAATLSKVLGRPIRHVQVPYEVLEKSMLDLGAREWQVRILLGCYKLIDEGDPMVNQSNIDDYETITGEKPTSLEQWVQNAKAAFQ